MNETSTPKRTGTIVWDSAHGHVCTCTRTENYTELNIPTRPSYEYTVRVSEGQRLPEDGMWKYDCERCGAVVWSAR